MSVVVVERTFPAPVAFEEIEAQEERAAWCLEAHSVRRLKTYLSADRLRMVCLYQAPDAESVRLAQEKGGMPFDKVWASHVLRHDGADVELGAVVMERVFSDPVDEPSLRALVAQKASCMEAWSTRIVWSYLSLDGLRCLCVFTAPDAESVRQAQKLAGLPSMRAWPASIHEHGSPH